ncbi:hypothetical protein [Paraburkholderia megapolitana]|uniref:hypothetical protein n=1 Tax=Paraburkholderia megapolitana TaxID=420953 RepID=UPI000B8A29EC|nr:hypothetical protein [Paraburkholderia megapolitana]QDQ80997.1 hypothetical protein FNZ07_07320 [Paraburkholderia megapolitana]
MNFLTKLIACFLIAWLPILGYPAQAPACSGMSTAMSPSSSHEYQSMTGSEHDHKHGSAAPCVKLDTVCQTGMNDLYCGVPGVLPSSHRTIAATTSLPEYRRVNHTLDAQFVPEPPQRPPQSA